MLVQYTRLRGATACETYKQLSFQSEIFSVFRICGLRTGPNHELISRYQVQQFCHTGTIKIVSYYLSKGFVVAEKIRMPWRAFLSRLNNKWTQLNFFRVIVYLHSAYRFVQLWTNWKIKLNTSLFNGVALTFYNEYGNKFCNIFRKLIYLCIDNLELPALFTNRKKTLMKWRIIYFGKISVQAFFK